MLKCEIAFLRLHLCLYAEVDVTSRWIKVKELRHADNRESDKTLGIPGCFEGAYQAVPINGLPLNERRLRVMCTLLSKRSSTLGWVCTVEFGCVCVPVCMRVCVLRVHRDIKGETFFGVLPLFLSFQISADITSWQCFPVELLSQRAPSPVHMNTFFVLVAFTSSCVVYRHYFEKVLWAYGNIIYIYSIRDRKSVV